MQNLNNGSVVNLGTANFGETKQDSAMSTPRSLESVNPISKVVGLTPKLNLNTIKVIKKDGTKEDYNVQKVVSAIKKSAARMLVEFTEKELEDICQYVNAKVLEAKQMEIDICNAHFSDWKKCTISARADKDIWLLFCYRMIEALNGYIERYSF